MSRNATNLRRATALFIAMTLLSAVSLLAQGSGSASIDTNKKRYAVGETMTITGSGFAPNNIVTLSVLTPDKVTEYVTGVVSDGSGSFSALYAPADPRPGRYRITATDGTNSANTATTEADAIGYNKGVHNKRTVAQNDNTG